MTYQFDPGDEAEESFPEWTEATDALNQWSPEDGQHEYLADEE